MHDPIKVLLISGSIRQPSYTRSLTEAVENALVLLGATTSQWKLCETPLPCADPEFHYDPARHTAPRVRSFVALADSCDAFVLASPVYHNSYSGVLKNAVDHLTIAHFRYKPVGLVSHGGNRSTQAVDHLRIVVRGLLGVAIPTQVCTAQKDYRQDGELSYQLESEEISRRIERFASELMVFADRLRPVHQSIVNA